MARARRLEAALDEYFSATRRPFYSILAAAPFFAAYELGLVFLLPRQPPERQVRNLAELVLHLWASPLGRHATFLLPVIAGMALLYSRHVREVRGRRGGAARSPAFRPGFLLLMLAESALLAVPLLLTMGFLARELPRYLAAGAPGSADLFDLTSVCGAGAYEELLFRLFLFSALYWPAEALLKLERLPAWLLAAGVSSLAFGAFHFIGGRGFDPVFFVFAALAGMYLAALCRFRSFGTAVATHAAYDIMVLLPGLLA